MSRAPSMTQPRPDDVARRTGLGLPPTIRACLFDLDGVLTQTARLHAAAWKQMFDQYLRARAEGGAAEPFVPFDAAADYLRFVDGKARADGVRSFLASRGIALPEGEPADGAEDDTVHGLGSRKNDIVRSLIAKEGVDVFEGSIRYVRAAREAGLRTAVVSSSANGRDVLDVAGIGTLFDTVVDGIAASEHHLRGKPAPDMFLAAAQALGVRPSDAAVFEDAEAGVEAGRAGAFGLVVGVDRGGRSDALRSHGADLVVTDLAELLEGG
jgi:beta-phosphoglucomutase family hydrolase